MPGSTHPTSCLSPSPWGHDPWDGAVRGRRGPPTTSLAHKAEKSLGGGQELGELVREWGTERKKQQHVARGPRLPCFLFLDSTTKTPAATASKNRTTAMQGVRTTRAMSRLQEKNFCPRTSRLHPAAAGTVGQAHGATARGSQPWARGSPGEQGKQAWWSSACKQQKQVGHWVLPHPAAS